jgi:hypothetical protein
VSVSPADLAAVRGYPSCAAYLRALPEGFTSFPDGTALVETYARLREDLADLGDGGGFPEPMARLLRDEYPRDAWISETIGIAVEMVLVDRIGMEGFTAWCYADSRKLFDGPLVRHLMRLVSPTLVVMGASRRWNAFHRGSDLAAEPVRKEGDLTRVRATLTYPPGMFPREFLLGITGSFQAALDLCHAREARAELTPASTPGLALYDVTWR